jgi:Tfp pilus assembly protein PilF
MNNKFFYITTLVIFYCFSYNTSSAFIIQDSLKLNLNELFFETDKEKNVFEGLNQDEKSTISLFFSLDKDFKDEDITLFNQKINSVALNILNSNLIQKNELKTIKKIYPIIHDSFFKKYEDNVFLYETLKTGKYNCVTASIIYSFIFNRLNIPNDIKVTPTHVYLIAYPKTSKIIIETTYPTNGFIELTQQFKIDFINSLKENKLIDAAELNSNSLDDLFDKYYIENHSVNLKQLAALQYYNKGVFYQDDKKYKLSMKTFEKALYLYNYKQIYDALQNSYLMYYSEIENTKDEDIDILFKIYQYGGGVVKDKDMVGKFEYLIRQEYEEGNISNVNILYDSFSKNISSAKTKEEICFIYHYQKIRENYLKSSKSNELMISIDTCLSIRPNNRDVQNFAALLIITKLSQGSDYIVMETLADEYNAKYPFMTDNKTMIIFQASLYSRLAGRNFQENDIINGEKYLTKFEKYYHEKQSPEVEKLSIAYAYAEAGAAYFRKNQLQKAKEAILKGLEFAPENFELKERLKIVNQYHK